MAEKLPGAVVGVSFSTSQFYFCKLSASTAVDFEVDLTTAVTQRMIGVIQNDSSSSGDAADVILTGIGKLQYAGAVTQGDAIGTNAEGRGISITEGQGGTTGLFIGAYALQSGTSGGVYTVYVTTPHFATDTG